jgi:hypothetical protein
LDLRLAVQIHRTFTELSLLACAGLSYTTFSYSVVDPSPTVSLAATQQYLRDNARHGGVYAPLRSEVVANYAVSVTNTGSVDAEDVVLGFTVPPGAGQNGTPLTELFGFQRVFVPAGQTVQVWLGLEARHLTQVNSNGARVIWPGEYTVNFGVKATAQHGGGFVSHTFSTVA